MEEEHVFNVPSDVREAFKALSIRRKYRWIIIGLETIGDKQTFEIESAEEDKSKSILDLGKVLPAAEPRYVIFDYEYLTDDNRKTDKLFFIMWSPTASTEMRMIYLAGKLAIRNILQGVYDLNCSTIEELERGVLQDRYVDEEVESDDDDWMDK